MSENKLNEIKNGSSFSTAILRTFYLSVVVLTVAGNIFLVSNGYSSWSIYLLTTASVIMAVLMIGIFKNQKNTERYIQHGNNVKEAQRIIFDVENKFLPFLRRRNAAKLENTSIEKAALEPLNWIICVFVFWIFLRRIHSKTLISMTQRN